MSPVTRDRAGNPRRQARGRRSSRQGSVCLREGVPRDGGLCLIPQVGEPQVLLRWLAALSGSARPHRIWFLSVWFILLALRVVEFPPRLEGLSC